MNTALGDCEVTYSLKQRGGLYIKVENFTVKIPRQ